MMKIDSIHVGTAQSPKGGHLADNMISMPEGNYVTPVTVTIQPQGPPLNPAKPPEYYLSHEPIQLTVWIAHDGSGVTDALVRTKAKAVLRQAMNGLAKQLQ